MLSIDPPKPHSYDQISDKSTVKPNETDKRYFCYLLISACGRRTYIGATVDLSRRLRQHNGAIVGGARATRGYRPWHVGAVCSGFATWAEALRFEWRWKRVGKKARHYSRGVTGRLRRARELCASVVFDSVTLRLADLCASGA